LVWLNKMRPPWHIWTCNYLSSCNKTHSKARLIEIVNILILNAVLVLNLF
jgi:hypothetical protein